VNALIPPEALDRLRRRAFLLPLLLVAAVYANTLQGDFVWDDHPLIQQQEVVQQLASFHEYFLQLFWSDPLELSRGFYRPLVTWSYAVEWRLWGGQPGGFHLTNVLLHLGCTSLVYLLCRRAGGSAVGSAVAASGFGLFPRLTESVAWVAGRTDVMASLGGFAALLLYDVEPSGRARRRAAAGALLLGLFCKEVALTSLVGLVALEAVQVRRHGRPPLQAARHLLPFLPALALYGALRVYALLADTRTELVDPDPPTLLQRLGGSFAGLAHYARMALVDPLRPELQVGFVRHVPWGLAAVGAVLLGVGAYAVWRARSRLEAWQVVALAAGSSALAMVSSVVLLLNVLAADRFLYVPVAMMAVGLVVPAERWARRFPAPGVAACVLVLGAFAVATHLRNREWNDEYLLWKAALRTTDPRNKLAAQGMAAYLMDAGRYDRALHYLERARAVGVGDSLALHSNIALALGKLGRHPEAVALFESIVRQVPDAQRARLNLAMSYARLHRWEQASRELEVLQAQAPLDGVVPKLRELFQSARATVESLPPEQPGEPAELTARRAQLYEELGAPHEASRYWSRVALAPDATFAQRRRGAGYLVFYGDLGLATRALERLRQEALAPEELATFEEELRRRAALE
jgi:hypothetical protein